MVNPDLPFPIGTVVNVNGGFLKGRNVIHECHVEVREDGSLSIDYSTNRGAWVSHDNCVVVEGPSLSSIQELFVDLEED